MKKYVGLILLLLTILISSSLVLADGTSTPEPTITPEVLKLIRYANYGGTGYLVFDLTGIDLSQIEQPLETNSSEEDEKSPFKVLLNDDYEVSCVLAYLDPDSKLPPIEPLNGQEPNVLLCRYLFQCSLLVIRISPRRRSHWFL